MAWQTLLIAPEDFINSPGFEGNHLKFWSTDFRELDEEHGDLLYCLLPRDYTIELFREAFQSVLDQANVFVPQKVP